MQARTAYTSTSFQSEQVANHLQGNETLMRIDRWKLRGLRSCTRPSPNKLRWTDTCLSSSCCSRHVKELEAKIRSLQKAAEKNEKDAAEVLKNDVYSLIASDVKKDDVYVNDCQWCKLLFCWCCSHPYKLFVLSSILLSLFHLPVSSKRSLSQPCHLATSVERQIQETVWSCQEAGDGGETIGTFEYVFNLSCREKKNRRTLLTFVTLLNNSLFHITRTWQDV